LGAVRVDGNIRVTWPRLNQEASMDESEVFYGPCCFCGQQISAAGVDPCRVRVETSHSLWQVWFCHAKCFRERIVDDPNLDLSPAHF
jgi:hypothetical protein